MSRSYVRVSLIFSGFALAVYALAMGGGFVFDDFKVIAGNQFIRQIFPLSPLWGFDPTRFIPNFTFALNFAIGGIAAWQFRLVNVFFHILTALGVFSLARELSAKRIEDPVQRMRFSCFAGLIFLLHPVQTSTVSYIVQRSTILATLFYVGSILMYLKGLRCGGRKGLGLYSLSLVCALCGSMSKPIIISLPLVMLVLESLEADKKTFLVKRILRLIPFFLIPAFVAVYLLFLKEGGVGRFDIVGLTRQTTMFSRTTYLLTEFNVIVYYVGLIFFPIGLRIDYDFPIFRHFFEMPTPLSFLTLAAFIYFGIRTFRRYPLVSFAIFWFLLTLFPESSIFPLDDVAFEHRLYLPLVGVALIIAWLIVHFPCKKTGYILGLILIVVMAGLSMHRNWIWGNAERLLNDTASKSPTHVRPLYNLSSYYMGRGNFKKAEEALERAFTIIPNFPPTHYKRGMLWQAMGNQDGALTEFVLGAQADQSMIASDSAWRAASIYQVRGNIEQARKWHQRSIDIYSRQSGAYIDLANIYSSQGDTGKAKELYHKALLNDPYNVNGYNGLAAALATEGDLEGSISVYKKGLKYFSESVLLLMNLSKVYFLENKHAEAAEGFKKIADARPDNTEALYYLGMAQLRLQNKEQAEKAFRRLLQALEGQGRDEEAEQIKKRFFKEVPAQIIFPDGRTVPLSETNIHLKDDKE